MPNPADAAPWGSRSTSSTLRPYSASAAPRLIVVVVLPTPPFWLHIAMIRAGPCPLSGSGTGKSRAGGPAGVSVLTPLTYRPPRPGQTMRAGLPAGPPPPLPAGTGQRPTATGD